jgi:hypothetical protein
MAKRVVNESSLTSVADAIRDKSGTTSSLVFPEGFISAIGSITPGEGGITPNGTINITTNGIHDVTSFASANVNVPTSGGDIVYGEDIEVGSLSELHIWEKYTVGGTTTETVKDTLYVDLAQKGSVDGRVYYADSYSVVNGELQLNNPTLIDLYNATNTERKVILGKYINPVKNGGYYRVPSDAAVTASKPSTGYHYVSITPAYGLSYSGADGQLVGIVVSEDSNAYPQNGEQYGYKYVYNGTLDSKSAVLKTLDVTPSASGQEFNPPAGYDGFSKVTVAGDGELLAGNIKKGINIFGVTGTYEGYGGTALPTLTTPGTAEDMAKGKQLIDENGNVVTGTVKDNRVWYGTYSAEPEIYTSGGYEFVMLKLKPSETTMVRDTVELCTRVSKFGDATSSDVLVGKTFTSAAGLKVVGTMTPGSGSGFTVTDDGAGNVTITSSAITDNNGNVVIA